MEAPTTTTATQSGNAELDRLRRLAGEEAEVNRTELQRLYEAAMDLTGEVRYHALWRLNQLRCLCSRLERPLSSFTDWEELSRLRQELTGQMRAAVELRQEAQTLMNACGASSRTSVRSSKSVSRTASKLKIQDQVSQELQSRISV